MVDKKNPKLSVRKQCEILNINRSSLYYKPKEESAENLILMRLIDEEYLKHPFYGSRRMVYFLRRVGYKVESHRVRRLMKLMGLAAIYQKPNTSKKEAAHKIYPYLLKERDINSPNQVWSSDITYLPMKHGFMYLVAVMDWYSRKVLSFRISNSLDKSFCIEALEDAIQKYGTPQVFNTDQGCQYTSLEFTSLLKEHDIQISMDSKGSWRDNVMIERLWRSIKYECLYLEEFEDVYTLRQALQKWIFYYNTSRPHTTFDGQTPEAIYNKSRSLEGIPSREYRAA